LEIAIDSITDAEHLRLTYYFRLISSFEVQAALIAKILLHAR